MANGGSVIFKFEGDTSDLEKATGKVDSALETLAKSFTIAEVASTALDKGVQLITDNLGNAIKRFDTMNNFPKVMESLGFKSEDASKAVETLSDGLLGLPTALNDSITYVQRFTAKNNDLDKSSQIFLAINDAILAGGASAETQASAIEQFTQSFTKGKPDLMEWRTLLSAMPGQLKQIAQSMGYASADDLYEAFKNNKVSMDDFTDAVIRLDKDGIGSISSFKEQAKNATGGIGTSWENLKTRTTKAITDVIGKIDDNLKSIGGISGAIEKLGEVIKNIINFIGDAISFIFKFRTQIGLVAGAFAVWKASTKIVTGLKLAIEGSKKATLLYKGIVLAFNAVQAIWNGLMVAGKVAVALFTGQITLAQAATILWSKAQAVLNGVLSANPIGAAIIAVAALVAGITALIKAIDTSTEEEKQQAEEMKKSAEQAEETRKAFEDLEEQQNKAISEGISQLNHIQTLADELRNLADASGYVKEQDRARAEFILGQLNEALGTEYSMIDGQIQKYEELSSSIDEMIEKKKMQVMFEAREEEYKKSLAEWSDLLKEKEEARLEAEKAREDFEQNSNEANNNRMIDAQKRWEDISQAVNDAGINIRSYEDAMTANLQGNTEKAKQLLMDKELSFKSFEDTVKLGSEEQTRVLKEQQDIAIQNFMDYSEKFKQGVEGYTLYGLQKAGEYATKAKEEYTKAGQNINQGLADGLNRTQDQVNGAIGNEAEGMKNTFQDRTEIHSPSRVFYGYGENINNGLINGLNSNSGSVFGAIGSIANGLISSVQNILGIHSPSRVFRDEIGKNMALGIGIGFENAIVGVENNINKSVADMIPNLDLGNVFDLSPTLHNTTTSNSNVNVTIYNNMETDMMGNLINNIKTYSNGAKNDYNYGMA